MLCLLVVCLASLPLGGFTYPLEDDSITPEEVVGLDVDRPSSRFGQMLVSRRDPDRLIKNQYVGRIRPGKRIDFANRFHAVRGKRFPETSPSGTDLRGLISYLQYLQNDRQSALGRPASKRQPPTGFHAVRGKRAVERMVAQLE